MANLSKELANAYAIRASKRRRKRELELPDHVAMANAYIAAIDKAKGRSPPRIIDSFWETAVYVGAILVGVLILLQFRDSKESEISKAEYFLAGYVFPIWVTRAYGRYRHGHQLCPASFVPS